MAAPPLASFRQTYGAVAAGIVSVASATDIFTITGSATKTVYPLTITVSGLATAAAFVDMYIRKRSTANTAGTSSAPTRVAFSSSNLAVSATVLAYTANPTQGTLVGDVMMKRVPLLTSGAVPFNPEVVFDFRPQMGAGSPVCLNGITEVLALNLNGVTVTGGTFDVSIVWAETL